MLFSALEKADKIADYVDLFDIVITQFQARPIFNENHQLKTIKPTNPEITREMGLVSNTFEINTQLIGDHRANVVTVANPRPDLTT